jgi:hypothetical protein
MVTESLQSIFHPRARHQQRFHMECSLATPCQRNIIKPCHLHTLIDKSSFIAQLFLEMYFLIISAVYASFTQKINFKISNNLDLSIVFLETTL